MINVNFLVSIALALITVSKINKIFVSDLIFMKNRCRVFDS